MEEEYKKLMSDLKQLNIGIRQLVVQGAEVNVNVGFSATFSKHSDILHVPLVEIECYKKLGS